MITEYALSVSVSAIPYVGTICSVASLLGDAYNAATQSYIEELEPGTIYLCAGTKWNRSYIQVYNESDGYWYTTQSSEYAVSEAAFSGGYVYDADNDELVWVGGVWYSGTVYSPYYDKTELRKTRAVIAYLNNYKLYDHTGDIDFYFTNPDSNDPNAGSILLFTHKEDVTYKYPYKEDN